jgi:hypothetical protein
MTSRKQAEAKAMWFYDLDGSAKFDSSQASALADAEYRTSLLFRAGKVSRSEMKWLMRISPTGGDADVFLNSELGHPRAESAGVEAEDLGGALRPSNSPRGAVERANNVLSLYLFERLVWA